VFGVVGILDLAGVSISGHLDEFGVIGPKIITQSKAMTEDKIREPALAAKTINIQGFPRTRGEEVA
jgi:hypothetical protein